MNDSYTELVLRAGAAAGMEVGVIHQRPHRRCAEGWTPWDPLADDGDALRLACRLKLNIAQGDFSAGVNDEAEIDEAAFVRNDAEREAVVRRLIVTAAALAISKTPSARVTGPQQREKNYDR